MEWKEILTEVDAAWGSLSRERLEERLVQIDAEVKTEFGENSPFYGAMENELGAFYRGAGKYDEAVKCFQTALTLFKRDDPGYATSLNNLAGTHRLAGQPEAALSEFETCLGLYESTVGKNHILYASCLNNMSLVYLDLGDIAAAEGLQQRAASILRNMPACRDELATSLINLGILCQRLGRRQEAAEKLEEAICMLQEELGTKTPHYHAALNALGLLRFEEKNFAEAERLFHAAAEAAADLYGQGHRETQMIKRHALMAHEAGENQG